MAYEACDIGHRKTRGLTSSSLGHLDCIMYGLYALILVAYYILALFRGCGVYIAVCNESPRKRGA